MQFKDTKLGYPIYIIDRKAVTVTTGKVTNSPLPHFDPKCPTSKMVVDLSVETGGSSATYVLDDTAEVGYVGNLVITADRDNVTRELECIKSQCEESIKMEPWNHEAVAKCDKILQEYSPEYKQRSEYSERITSLENKFDRLNEAITQIIKKLDQ